MKGKISTGIWLLLFGIIALLYNFDLIDFNFWVILTYWPLIIIAVGVNLIFQNKKNGTLITAIINILLCVFIIYKGLTENKSFTFSKNITINTTSNDDDTTGSKPVVSYLYDQNIETASLTMNIGASNMDIGDQTTINLIEANTKNENIGLKLNSKIKENHSDFVLSSVLKEKNKNTINTPIQISMNPRPLWDYEFNIGASKFNGDLSAYKFSKLELNTGATSLKLKLGMPATENTEIEMNTAASSCVITIPNEAACRVEIETVMSNNKLPGFNKVDSGYETENYNQAQKKYTISITGAANSLKINRY